MATSLVGYVASVLGLRLFWGGDVDAPLFIEETFPILLMFGCVLLSCCVLSFVTNNKERNEMLEDMLLLERNGNEELYRRIADAYGLTNREREVLCLVARGYSRPAICKELFLAESTVRSHIKHVYAKLNVHSKDEAIFAVEQFKRNHVN